MAEKNDLSEGIIYGYEGRNSTKKGSLGAYQKANNASSNKHSSKLEKAIIDEGLMGVDHKYIRDRMFTKFSKFGYNDPYSRLTNTKEVLFFTKPNLNIVDTNTGNLNGYLENSPFFIDLRDKYVEVIHELQSDFMVGSATKSYESPFIMSLHNRVKDTLDLPDISSNDIDLPVNMYGNDYSYRGSSEPSDDQHSFNLEFEDTKYLDIYMLFRAYEEYERYKRLGRVAPPDDCITKKELHDQIAIYKFVLADDFMTIIHYSELWGCYPTGVPRSVFGSNDFGSSGLSLSIPWKCAFVEDMNPLIISDFNHLMEKPISGIGLGTHEVITQSGSNGRINREWADGAMIVEKPINLNGKQRKVYQLKWIKNK